MAYGLSILPEDGGKAVDITTSARVPAFLEFAEIHSNTVNGQTVHDVPNVTAGASVFVIPTQPAIVYSNSTTPYPLLNVIDHIDITGNHLDIKVKSSNSNLPYANNFVKLNAYQVTGAGGNGNYGIQLIDNTDFMNISDANIVGGCVFRQTVTVNGSWPIPSIEGRDNCVVFANWSNANVRVTYDARNKVIEVWGQNATSASADLHIVIFANKINLSPPSYGLAVFNKANQCTFSSKYAPLLLRGSFSLAKNPGSPASFSTPFDRPLVPLGKWGAWVFAGSSYEVFHAGMVMNEGTLTTGSAGRISSMPNAGGNVTSMIATMSLPLLDARDYFDSI